MDKRAIENLIKEIKDLLDEYVNTTDDSIKKNEKSADKINKKKKQIADEINTDTEKSWDKVGKNMKNAALSAASSLLGQYEGLMKSYVDTQQQLSFNLLGTNMTYDSVLNSLKVFSTNTFVRQNDVYNNLNKLITSGISANATQRAFLQTTSDTIGLGYDTFNSNLNRLIQLQQTDISESRLVQMAGLREFLQQNYQNSQYIKNGFSQVSDALLEMQSIMKVDQALSTERTIQTYLGSFSSAGGGSSTMSSIAQALNAIGTGNFSGLDQGMQNLMIMAASRAGLSYADLLTGGLDATSSDALLTAAFSYIANMQDVGGGSNVAMNAFAKIFGVNVSDIRAASQMDLDAAHTGYNYGGINQFLSQVANTTPQPARWSNLFSNLASTAALNTDYFWYTLAKAGSDIIKDAPIVGGLVSQMVPYGFMLNGMFQGSDLGSMWSLDNVTAGTKKWNIWNLASNIKTIGGNILGLIGNTYDLFTQGFNEDSLSKILSETAGTGLGNYISGLMSTAAEGEFKGVNNVTYDENGNSIGTSFSFTNTGDNRQGGGGRDLLGGGGGSADSDESGSGTYITSTSATADEALLGIYDLLANDFPTTEWATMARIADGGNAVLLGNEDITLSIVSASLMTAQYTEGIFNLLDRQYGSVGLNSYISDMRDSISNWGTWGGWAGTRGSV